VTFEVSAAKHFPGRGYDLVAFFDCLHDMGDPAGAAAIEEAMEGGDAAALTSLYSDAAETTIVDRDRPPGAPPRVRGRAVIIAFWEDVCGRAVTRRLGREVIGPIAWHSSRNAPIRMDATCWRR
jgi:hypothetical protein